jgi:predicted pyridoxine 5'-phosphate oxidase superfamily flavin-nucleotide-binding protein
MIKFSEAICVTVEENMKYIPMYHAGSRRLQDQFSTRKLADRLVETYAHDVFTDEDRTFIESLPFFFLATADVEGRPDCSYKGGLPGFIRVVDPNTLAFPSYDGNGMFKSFGNVLVNPHVGLLFVDFENCKRLRVNGLATVDKEDVLLRDFVGAQLIVRVRAEAIFPNCPRYVHRMLMIKQSCYAPRENYTPPVPGWKRDPEFRGVLPSGDRAQAGTDIPERVTWLKSARQSLKERLKNMVWRAILRLRG